MPTEGIVCISYLLCMIPSCLRPPPLEKGRQELVARDFGSAESTEIVENPLCISQFQYCTDGAKDPPSSRRRIVQRFLRFVND